MVHNASSRDDVNILLSVHGLNKPLIFALKPVSCTLAVIDIEFQKNCMPFQVICEKQPVSDVQYCVNESYRKVYHYTCMRKRKSTC